MPVPPVKPIVASRRGAQQVSGPGAHPEYDASLLFWRMATLHIDREELATDDPLLFRELQGRCTLCLAKQRCIHDLASDLRGTSMDYCPNIGALNLLEALACSWGALRGT